MRSLVWIGILGWTACSNDVVGGPPDDVPRTCLATVTGGGSHERIEADLAAANQPTVTVVTRDGEIAMRWTYAYDDAGRLLVEEHDHRGPSGTTPDGVVDLVMTVEHSATSAIQRWGAPGLPAGETATSTLDTAGRVVRYDSGPASFSTFQLGATGLIEQHHVEGIDPDVGTPFMYTTAYAYDANGRLRTRGDLGSVTPMEYEHDVTAERMIVRRTVGGAPRGIFTYTYDGEGRTVRAEVDEDSDGTGDWRTDIAYGDDGSVTTTGSRDGNPGRVNTMSAGCGYVVTAPQRPEAWNRPGAQWQLFAPAIPNAYE